MEHSVVLGTMETARLAQQECVSHAVASGSGRAEALAEDTPAAEKPLSEKQP